MHHAVRGYLETAFRVFIDVDKERLAMKTVYHYFFSPACPSTSSSFHWRNCSVALFQNLEIDLVSAKTVPFPHATTHCMLVSSHKEPGFGPPCTQEEIITAAYPQLLPLGALLVQPPILDHAVLVARGVYPRSRWVGQGRDAHLQSFDDVFTTPYIFLFLDALELDNFDLTPTPYIPDLIPKNLIRELEKAYFDFNSISRLGVDRIVSPLSGCGAFGGDPVVRSLVLSMAAARAGISLTLMIDEKRQISHGRDSVKLAKDVLTYMKASLESKLVADVWKVLDSVSGNGNGSLELLDLL
ncbi:hypothetical protein AN958_01176 [Leucoagaricus sp. SymC.cos]|nr:hypothetical protein AN958_01176 [Leucoagaricus sp. SymC.cos]